MNANQKVLVIEIWSLRSKARLTRNRCSRGHNMKIHYPSVDEALARLHSKCEGLSAAEAAR
jgi:hypothetical protein